MDPNLLDIIIILTMLVSGLLALTQGFVKEILSLMGWIVSFVSVILLMPEAGNYLKPFFESQAISDLITISIIFIVTLLVWRLLCLFIVKLFKFTSIDPFFFFSSLFNLWSVFIALISFKEFF